MLPTASSLGKVGVDVPNPCSAKDYDHPTGLVCHLVRRDRHRVIPCQAATTLPLPPFRSGR